MTFKVQNSYEQVQYAKVEIPKRREETSLMDFKTQKYNDLFDSKKCPLEIKSVVPPQTPMNFTLKPIVFSKADFTDVLSNCFEKYEFPMPLSFKGVNSKDVEEFLKKTTPLARIAFQIQNFFQGKGIISNQNIEVVCTRTDPVTLKRNQASAEEITRLCTAANNAPAVDLLQRLKKVYPETVVPK